MGEWSGGGSLSTAGLLTVECLEESAIGLVDRDACPPDKTAMKDAACCLSLELLLADSMAGLGLGTEQHGVKWRPAVPRILNQPIGEHVAR